MIRVALRISDLRQSDNAQFDTRFTYFFNFCDKFLLLELVSLFDYLWLPSVVAHDYLPLIDAWTGLSTALYLAWAAHRSTNPAHLRAISVAYWRSGQVLRVPNLRLRMPILSESLVFIYPGLFFALFFADCSLLLLITTCLHAMSAVLVFSGALRIRL